MLFQKCVQRLQTATNNFFFGRSSLSKRLHKPSLTTLDQLKHFHKEIAQNMSDEEKDSFPNPDGLDKLIIGSDLNLGGSEIPIPQCLGAAIIID